VAVESSGTGMHIGTVTQVVQFVICSSAVENRHQTASSTFPPSRSLELLNRGNDILIRGNEIK